MQSRKLILRIIFVLFLLAILFSAITATLSASLSKQPADSKKSPLQKQLTELTAEWQEWKKIPFEYKLLKKKILIKQIDLPVLRTEIVNIFLKLNLPPPQLDFVNKKYFEEIRKAEVDIKCKGNYEQIKRLLYEIRQLPKLIFPLQVELKKEEVLTNAFIKLAFFVEE